MKLNRKQRRSIRKYRDHCDRDPEMRLALRIRYELVSRMEPK